MTDNEVPADHPNVTVLNGLRSDPEFYIDQIEQLAFELAFELEEAEVSGDELVTVNRDKLKAVATCVLSRLYVHDKADGNRPIPYNRDILGRFVREAWVRWAETQPNPKPSWVVPYDELSEPDKEADRQIGETIARWTLIGDAARFSQVEDHLKNIEETADAVSSPYRMSIIRKQALLALDILGQSSSQREEKE